MHLSKSNLQYMHKHWNKAYKQCNIMRSSSKVLFLKMTTDSLYYSKVANKTTTVIKTIVKQITIPPQTFLLQMLHFFSPEIAVSFINSATSLWYHHDPNVVPLT